MSKSIWDDPLKAKLYKSGEHITGPPAKQLIQQAGLLHTTLEFPLIILDNAYGTGIVTHLLYKTLLEDSVNDLHLTCGDISPVMIATVQEMIDTNNWKGIKAQVVDGQVCVCFHALVRIKLTLTMSNRKYHSMISTILMLLQILVSCSCLVLWALSQVGGENFVFKYSSNNSL